MAVQRGEDRHEQEDGPLREGITHRTRQQRDGDIAGMVEGELRPHPARELLSRVEAQGQGRDGGAEDVSGDGHQAVGHCHGPEGRPGEYDDRRDRQNGERENDNSPFGVGLVDRRADWGLDREPEQAADRRHQADLGLAPMLLGDEEDIEVGADRAPHVGREEIHRVERRGAKAAVGRVGVWLDGVQKHLTI